MARRGTKKYEDYTKETTTDQPESEPKPEIGLVPEAKPETKTELPPEPKPEKLEWPETKQEYKYTMPEKEHEMSEKVQKAEKPEKQEKTIYPNKISVEYDPFHATFHVAIESPEQSIEKVAGIATEIVTKLMEQTSIPVQPETAPEEQEEIPAGIVPDFVPEQDEYQRLIEKVKANGK